MTDTAWTGTPVRAHPQSRNNGSAALPWGRRREQLPLHWPFADAVAGHRAKALANPDFDPAATFVWGQMMAVGVIAMLRAAEERFGAEGHDMMRAALQDVGRKIVAEMVRGVDVPAELTPAEVASLFASWVNEVCYASVEAPVVESEAASFDIHYCPHEDVYGAFDCRVQRYLVEGMIEAVRAEWPHVGFDVAFTSTIPSGSPTCHFAMTLADGNADAWVRYSDDLRDRALRIVDVT